jgi:hypothetical protein
MSIKLVLSHYLAGLRERNELDALLPELLLSMGHSVLSRPQVGVNQAGVDVVSTCVEADGRTVVYLFVIKFGDIGRDGFFGGKQAVDPSIREASNTFIRNRLPEVLQDCDKRIVLVSNGFLKQEAQDGFAALSKEIAERRLQTLDFWGSDHLTPLIEKHIFDESLLLAQGKADLRGALATLQETDASVQRFIRFVDFCTTAPVAEGPTSKETQRKNFLRRCAAAAMGWAVLLVWCQTEGNLKPGVVGGEYLLLRLWADAVRADLEGDEDVQQRLMNLASLQADALLRYYLKLAPHLAHRREVLAYRHEHVFYMDVIFEELGRMGLTLLFLQRTAGAEQQRGELKYVLVTLINEHTGCRLPVLDGQSIDLSLVLLALICEGDTTSAQALLRAVIHMFAVAVRSEHWLPVDTDLIEDAVALYEGDVEPRDYFKTSTLFPMLGTFAALLNDKESLGQLNDVIAPKLGEVTLERWCASAELETLAGSGRALTSVGISKAISRLQISPTDELQASLKTPPDAAAHDDFKWAHTPFELLAAVSARFYRHPLPIWFIANSYAHSSRSQEKADDSSSL